MLTLAPAMPYIDSAAAKSAVGIRTPLPGAHKRSSERRFFCVRSFMAGRMRHPRVAALQGGSANLVRSATLIRFAPAGGSSPLPGDCHA